MWKESFFLPLETQRHKSRFVFMNLKKEVYFILALNIMAYLYLKKKHL